ncbi:MAG: PhnD/SsuA/transferrin family substrate-binding protein [Pseudomonadota bacterium]|nr:PhnD/SsuA/transferrin family substrate-binding protein [Pseudomonadota bacterium]
MTAIKIILSYFGSFFILILLTSLVYAQNKSVKIGVLAFRTKALTLEQWQPTADYLSKAIPEHVFEVLPMFFDEVEQAVQQQRIDFLLTNSAHYVNLEYQYGITRIATLIQNAQGQLLSKFGGVVFTRADRHDINQLADLKDKHFLAVNPSSLGGFLAAYELLYSHNIEPYKDFSQLEFTGMPHDKVVLTVQAGQADAGTVRTGILEQLAQEGKIKLSDFKIIHQQSSAQFPFIYSTALYPEWPFAKLSDTSETLAKKVAIALLKLTPAHEAVQKGHYGGWAVPLDYQVIHEMMKHLKLGPYQNKDFTLTDVFNKYKFAIILFNLGVLIILLIAFLMLKMNRTLQHEIRERRAAEIENKKINQELQHEVEQHRSTLTELHQAQDQLLHSEKMITLGQLMAGIAHEINTPLGAIRSSADNINVFLKQSLMKLPVFFQNLSGQHQQQFLALLHYSTQNQLLLAAKEKRQLKRKLSLILETHELAHAAALADTLVDLNVTSEEVEQFLPLLKVDTQQTIVNTIYQLNSLQKSAQTITTASERAAKVISALKCFAHFDHSGEKTHANIIDGIETALTLYHNQIKQGFEVIRQYREISALACYPDELNQVWTNLIHNALQAMNNQGTLIIDVSQRDQALYVCFTDSGSGIKEAIKAKIFEPFFTTKPAGEGSGLGLDIVKKIIHKHEGRIEVDSQPGKTTFTIILPFTD